MQILDDLQVETRRLFIAGSKFAKDDPRILKFLPALEKMGEKAPVMKKLAEKYTLLAAEGKPEALADAGTFLYAVMATQGRPEISGEKIEIEPSVTELPKTKTPYSRLKPVIDALTLSAQGRYEVIVSAFKEGLLEDFRVYSHLAAALDDKYAAIAEYIYNKVIPEIGPVLIPYLLEIYDHKGKQADAMRLSLLGALGYENAETLAFAAVEEGSVLVAAEGIKILGKNSENENFLLTLAKDKKSEIREAAFEGLVCMDSAEGKELMLETLQKSKYKSAISAAKLCKDRECALKLLEFFKSQYDNLYGEGLSQSDIQKANAKLMELLPILENKNEPEVYEFCVQVLADTKYEKRLSGSKTNAYFSNSVQNELCRQLNKSQEAKDYLGDRMYMVFAKYYSLGALSFINLFCPKGIYLNEFKDKESMEEEFINIRKKVNSDWRQLFIYKQDMDAMRVLICEGCEHEKAMREAILKSIKNEAAKKRAGYLQGLAAGRLVEMSSGKKMLMFKSDLEQVAEVCYEAFEKADGYQIQYFYGAMGNENIAKLFGNKYAEKFKELAQKKSSGVFKEIAEILSNHKEN